MPPSIELAAHLYVPQGDAAHGNTGPTRLPGLIVGHGAGSRATRHHKFCFEAARHGFIVLAIDFRGHGASKGAGDGPLDRDLLAAAALLRDLPAVDPALIGYRGSSMGAFYGLKAAPMADFTAMVLLCPANETTMLKAIDRDDAVDSRENTERTDPRYVDTEDPAPAETSELLTNPTRWDKPSLRAYLEHQDSQSLAKLVTCPVMLVHARGDAVVPLAHSLRLTERLSGEIELVTLEGGSHSSAQHDPLVHLRSLKWLSTKMEQAKMGTHGTAAGR
jgi:dipeptidyl aminopeptidase/acylaminoacyl peptidase